MQTKLYKIYRIDRSMVIDFICFVSSHHPNWAMIVPLFCFRFHSHGHYFILFYFALFWLFCFVSLIFFLCCYFHPNSNAFFFFFPFYGHSLFVLPSFSITIYINFSHALHLLVNRVSCAIVHSDMNEKKTLENKIK